jgi:two-component system LytT family sensor kinase
MEKIRFQDRLEVRTEVEPSVLDAFVPNLVLQPIVENAIRYAVENRAGPTTVTVGGSTDGRVLRLWIANEGPGLRDTGAARGGRGVGISNTRKRLSELYGDEASLEMENRPPSGAVVTITLPLRTQPRADGEEQ